MTIKNIFLFEGTKEHDKHTLLRGIDEETASELIANNQAAEIDLSTYETYQDDFNNLYDEYKSDQMDIKNTDNPNDQSDEMQAYHLDILKKDFEARSNELQTEYKASLDEAIKQAERNSITATITTTPQDETTAKQMSNRLTLDLAATGDKNKGAKVKEIVDKLKLVSNAEKVALQSHASDILSQVTDESQKRLLIDELMNVKDVALLQREVLSQIPNEINTMDRVENLIKNANK